MSATIDRARALMARPGAWIEPRGALYLLRLNPDRRRGAALTLDEAGFRALAIDPGLKVRPAGGWASASGVAAAAPDRAGRPGWIGGRRQVSLPGGDLVMADANLGDSPVAWLLRRKDPEGRPYLTPAEAAAGERLRVDAEAAARDAPLTMRWDGLPKAGSGSAPSHGPGHARTLARERLRRALAALDPEARRMVRLICLESSSLTLAERDLGLTRRHGKRVLQRGLARLVEHYAGRRN